MTESADEHGADLLPENSPHPVAVAKSHRWRGKIRLGWVISAIFVLLFSYTAIWILSPWQLNKDKDIGNRNHQIEEGYSTEIVSYDEMFSTDGTVPEDKEWHRVQLTGHYLTAQEILLRLRPVNNGPAFQSLVPFKLDSGEIVLVNRGFKSSHGNTVPEMSPAPDTEVTIVALARKNERKPESEPLNDGGYQQVYGINTDQISELLKLKLAKDYVQLTDDQPGVLNPLPLPKLDRGSHLSYGMQWIAFGILAPLGLGYFIWSEFKERRRERREREELANLGASQQSLENHKVTTPTKPQQSTISPPKRSRYGSRKPNVEQKRAQRDEERF